VAFFLQPGAPTPLPSRNFHPFVCLALDAITLYVKESRTAAPVETLLDQFEILRRPAGVFVTLKKGGELRGCMGTFEPAQPNTAVEIIENAILAAFRDPRFPPFSHEEFHDLCVSVDILTPTERIFRLDDLDPARYGVIVRQGMRRGLLLPGLEDVRSVEEQVAIARRKGGIGEQETIDIYRFEVERYH
jgi:AmmeMemoRadiSam system protein A